MFCGTKSRAGLYKELPGIVQCSSCGLVYTTPRLKKEELELFYSKEYFHSEDSAVTGYDNYVSDRAMVEKTFNKRLERIESNWLPEKGKVLDVGCATGFFLSVARSRGWQVDGVEISKFCCDYALKNSNLKINQGFFTHINLPSDFKLVTMWDYLEHSTTPDKDIKRAAELLVPGGYIAVATPDFGSIPAKIFRHKWMGFKTHEHFYYFTKKDLERMFREAGFEPVWTWYAGKYVSAKFFLDRLGSYFPDLAGTLNKAAAAAGLADKVFYCNPFDIIYMVGRKTGSPKNSKRAE